MKYQESDNSAELKEIYQKNLRILEKRRAKYGDFYPSFLDIEIEQLKSNINELDIKLNTNTQSDKKKILIIDDNELEAKVIKLFLENKGFQVLVDHNGMSGMKTVTKETPDLVLLDIQLGDTNGYTILTNIVQRRIPTRVIIITAHHRTNFGMASTSITSGACSYLTKPFELEELAKLVQRAVEFSPTIDVSLRNPEATINFLSSVIDMLIDTIYEYQSNQMINNLIKDINNLKKDNILLNQDILKLKSSKISKH